MNNIASFERPYGLAVFSADGIEASITGTEINDAIMN